MDETGTVRLINDLGVAQGDEEGSFINLGVCLNNNEQQLVKSL